MKRGIPLRKMKQHMFFSLMKIRNRKTFIKIVINPEHRGKYDS